MEKSKTYKQRKKEQKIFTVIANCESMGTWTNLVRLSKDMNEIDDEFLSYSSLSKKRKDENPINFRTPKGIDYSVCIHVINTVNKSVFETLTEEE